VFARPITSSVAQSNLLISTAQGRQFVLILRSLGPLSDEIDAGVDLLVTCRAPGVLFIDETFPASVIPETVQSREHCTV